MRKRSYILAVVRGELGDLYIPSSFPYRSTDKQIAAVCRAFLDNEFCDWAIAAIDLTYYNRDDRVTKTKRIHIKKEEK